MPSRRAPGITKPVSLATGALATYEALVREHRRKISEVYLPMVQNRSMSAKEYNRKVDEAYRAMVMEVLTSKHQFDLVRQLPDMVRDRSATASNYLTVLKAVVRSKAPYLPEDIVVRPARDYARAHDARTDSRRHDLGSATVKNANKKKRE